MRMYCVNPYTIRLPPNTPRYISCALVVALGGVVPVEDDRVRDGRNGGQEVQQAHAATRRVMALQAAHRSFLALPRSSGTKYYYCHNQTSCETSCLDSDVVDYLVPGHQIRPPIAFISVSGM